MKIIERLIFNGLVLVFDLISNKECEVQGNYFKEVNSKKDITKTIKTFEGGKT